MSGSAAEAGRLLAELRDLSGNPSLWPTNASRIDIAHADGTGIYGDLLAFRFSGIEIDSDAAMLSEEKISQPWFVSDYSDDEAWPEWLNAPWIDIDGTPGPWGLHQASSEMRWYHRPSAGEFVVYINSQGNMPLPHAMSLWLRAARYHSVLEIRPIGSERRSWARIVVDVAGE